MDVKAQEALDLILKVATHQAPEVKEIFDEVLEDFLQDLKTTEPKMAKKFRSQFQQEVEHA